MNVPLDPRIVINSQNRRLGDLSKTSSPPLASNRSFESVLDTFVEQPLSQHPRPAFTPPLNPYRLRQLVLMINKKINAYLFNLAKSPRGATPGIVDSIPTQLREEVGSAPHHEEESNRESGTEPCAEPFSRMIDHAAGTHGVDPGLIQAVIKAESDFDPECTSPKGAMGLMQLMPETAAELGVSDPYDPHENIMGGTCYLKMLLDRYHGDIRSALAAYNWGMGNLERHPDRLPSETHQYIFRVQHYHRAIQSNGVV